MAEHRRKATIIDVASAASVSKSTVSLVLQGSPRVRPATTGKVQAAIHRLGYVYNRGAANLRSARSNVVGMVINDLANPFFAELAVGIESVFRASGLVSLIAHTAESPNRQADVLKAMREQAVCGLIICPARGTDASALSGFARAGTPVVLAMRHIPGSRLASVVPDNARGAAEAVRHLQSLGHRRIAFVGGHDDMSAQRDRFRGYANALTQAAMPVDPALIVESAPTRDGGIAAIGAVLALDDPADAALCFNDVVAFGAMHGLRHHGREAGRDFGIVGFDDVREAADHVPSLTTVAVDSAGIGARAAQAALRMVESGRISVEEQTTSVHLVVRESCGARARGIGRQVA